MVLSFLCLNQRICIHSARSDHATSMAIPVAPTPVMRQPAPNFGQARADVYDVPLVFDGNAVSSAVLRVILLVGICFFLVIRHWLSGVH